MRGKWLAYIFSISVVLMFAEYAYAENHKAVAVVHPTEGHSAQGVVWFSQEGNSVKIMADITGLTPNASHGFHIHQFGDCSMPDGKSAGGHYNPEGHEHAGPETALRHAGDLGNLEADDKGQAHYEITVNNISINGEKNPIVGRGLIVHQSPDDLNSQPTGNAGARIGCAVIGIAQAE